MESLILYHLYCIFSGENIVDSPDAFGMSPLMIASQKGYTRLSSDFVAVYMQYSYSNPLVQGFSSIL